MVYSYILSYEQIWTKGNITTLVLNIWIVFIYTFIQLNRKRNPLGNARFISYSHNLLVLETQHNLSEQTTSRLSQRVRSPGTVS